jgi:protein SCO1/2
MARSPTHPISAMALVVAAGLCLRPADALATDAPDAHAQHEGCAAHANTLKRARRSTANYLVPDVRLVRDDGKEVSLAPELDDGRAVVLQFIFTTCTTICPVMAQTFAQLQEELGDDRDRVHLVSISIDPEQDTPARLREYARKVHAGPQWRYYTGTVQASVDVQRAFNAYLGDKMNHTPATFLRAAAGRPWVRIDGFASADELARELHQLVAAR